MTVYFCMDHMLEAALQGDDFSIQPNALVPVYVKAPDCKAPRQDTLILSSQPKLLNLNDPSGVYQFAALLEEVPLYHINLELLLDRALTVRHENNLVAKALERSFEGQTLPNTLAKEKGSSRDPLEGSLQHPMLGHLDRSVLCKIYINFVRALPHGHDEFSFENHVLGSQINPFRERFSGYIAGQTGKVRADILIGFGMREDFDPRSQLENYVENGRAQATLMRINEKKELLWAWLEADNYQMRRCHDIDRMLSLKGLPRIPNWTRSDIFKCLEKEAMKQVLAIRLIEQDPTLSCLPAHPAIRKTIEASAQGQIDEALKQLPAQILNTGAAYSGSAGRFHLRARERERESRSL